MIVSPESIKRAGEIIQTIETLQGDLARLFGGQALEVSAPKRRGRPPGSVGKRRGMSAEGRARIAAAAKARWARFRAEKTKPSKSKG